MRSVCVRVAALSLCAAVTSSSAAVAQSWPSEGLIPALLSGSSEKRSGEWRIGSSVDSITGKPAPKVYVVAPARNTKVMFTRPAGLQLMCFKGEPVIRFGFEFTVGANTSAALAYRFDDKPGHDAAQVRILPDHRTVMIEDKTELARFVAEMRGASKLLVKGTSLVAGATAVEFSVAGAASAIEAAFEGCPLPSAAAPAAAKPAAKRKS